jgi:hypothetical protein
MGDEGEDRVKKTYGDNYERLVAIKNKYDPGNLFRVNQNIKPTTKKSETVAGASEFAEVTELQGCDQ